LPRPAIWLVAFLAVVLVVGALMPVAEEYDPLRPEPLLLWIGWGMKLVFVGFGAALASREGRSRGAVSLGVLVFSGLAAAAVGLLSPRWLWPLSSFLGLEDALAVVRPIARVWLGAVVYELVKWRPRRAEP